jgi:large subunit ribosomal protein L21
MKKAVITTGSKQYLVAEGDQIDIELLKDPKEKLSFETMLVVDDEKTVVGKPLVEGVKVTATVVEANIQTDKVTSIRYKAKKRVHTVRGHRQRKTTIKINKIA